jgi:sulfoquinovose isomerase
MLHLRAALEARFETPPEWLLEDAKGLFHATIRDAWAPDGADGFVYSVGWDGKPIVRERVRWPIVEAMGTAYALHRNRRSTVRSLVSEVVGLLH